MDPIACRDHLAKLLSEECEQLARLETLLEREHEMLLADDVEQLERAGDARQACVAELLRLEDERQSLCRMLNVPGDSNGLERLLRWCDPTGSLAARWGDCAQRAARCRDANLRNGALVTARLKRVEGLLGVLTGRPQQAQVYGKQGSVTGPISGTRVAVAV